MGLDTTHDCWHGSYSGFDAFRRALCAAAGFDMHEVYKRNLKTPEELAALPNGSDAIHILANHPDNEGTITRDQQLPLAARLHELLPALSQEWQPDTKAFIRGLLRAYKRGEVVEFH